jgi:hypothetical protein
MTTKPVPTEAERIEAFRRTLARPREVVIDGARAYWLGGLDGNALGPESDRTIEPCAQALTMVRSGTDPETLVVWARLDSGEVYRVAGGIFLVSMAKAAAGIPAGPRVPRE